MIRKFTVPPATFKPGGDFEVTDAASALAASVAALKIIAGIPHAYHARGPAFIVDEIARVAVAATRTIDAAVNAPAPAGQTECLRLDLAFPVVLEQHPDLSFRVTYGVEVHDRLDYRAACYEFGKAVLHALACSGDLDNSEPDHDADGVTS